MTDSVIRSSLAEIPTGGRDEETESARDENDAIVRQEEATREQFGQLVTVYVDGHPVTLPKAVPVTDPQGNPVRGADGELIPRNSTIYDAGLKLVADGTWTQAELHRRLPVLCHQPHLPAVGVCRMCAVWIVHTKRGEPRTERKLLPACQHLVTDAMRVTTRSGRAGFSPEAEVRLREAAIARGRDRRAADGGPEWTADDEAKAIEAFDRDWAKYLTQVDEWSARIRSCQGVLAELLVADHRKPDPSPVRRYVNELDAVADTVGVATPRPGFARSPDTPSRNAAADRRSRRLPLPLAADRRPPAGLAADLPYSSRTVVVDHDRCILCDRCVRSCGGVKPFNVIGHTGKGYDTRVSFDLDDLMEASSCVQCGECMTACPTGALSVGRRVQPRAWADSPEVIPLDPTVPFPSESGFLSAEEMQRVTLRYRPPGERRDVLVTPFATIPFAYLKWNEGAVRRWVIPPGGTRVLCREGEYASTAFLTEGSGMCQIFSRRSRSKSQAKGLFSRLFGSGKGAAELGLKIREVRGRELIQGEIACLSHTRRTASVVAAADPDTPMVVYEVTRNLLDMMQRTPAIREAIARLYTYRAVQACVSKGEMFDGLATMRHEAAVKLLTAGGLELRRLDANQTVVREGDPAGGDHTYFYIVRTGTLRVFQTAGGVEKLLRVLEPGDFFGEAALRAETPTVRSASVVTLDPTELVLVPKAAFLDLCERFPEVVERMAQAAADRAPPPPVDYVEQGLYQAQNLLALDLVKCTRCDECTKACADSHPDGNARLLRDGLRFGDFLVANSCRSCRKPYCMDGCPVDAIHRRGDHLEVVIEDHCIGCGLCERNCPYGSIHMAPRTTPNRAAAGFADGNPFAVAALKAVNCDLCGGGEPYCVHACPHDAAIRIDGQGLLNLVQNRRPG